MPLFIKDRRGGLSLSARGITQHLPFHRKFIAWEEMGALEQKGGDILTFLDIVGPKERIRFWKFISHREQLLTELQVNAPQVVVSPEILPATSLATVTEKTGHESNS